MNITNTMRIENPNEKKEDVRMKEHIELLNHNVRHPHIGRHIAPHERKNMIHIEFDERDWEIFAEVFGDEDTAAAVVEIIHNAPPEIQILAIQVLKMIEEVA